LIRHGETQWNLDQRVQGHHDVPLTPHGEAQARALARYLEDEPLHAIYTSDLSRARVTAEIVAGGRLPLRLEPRVREVHFGLFEGLMATEIAARHPEAYQNWRRDAVRHRPPEGETLEDLRARCLAAAGDCLARHPGETVAIFTHGGPVRVLVCGLLALPLGCYPRLRVENTSVTRIVFSDQGAILAALNDTAHLRHLRHLAAAQAGSSPNANLP
jgi:broad specificity phosphatase PhoE